MGNVEYEKFIGQVESIHLGNSSLKNGSFFYLEEFNLWQSKDIISYKLIILFESILKKILTGKEDNIHFFEITISQSIVSLMADFNCCFVSFKVSKELVWSVKVCHLYSDEIICVETNNLLLMTTLIHLALSQ